MYVAKIEDGIFEITASRTVDADRIHADLSFMERQGMLTFGDQTTRILESQLKRAGHRPQLTDLCFEDDLSIGLQMPKTWYLNRGLYALSISMYFNFLNYKEQAKAGELYTKNAEVVEDFGRIAAVEVYLERELEPALRSRGSVFFGTPRTLTECMRVLEGWDVARIPRLKRYITYAGFIRMWCQHHFPDFDESQWGLGKEQSKEILRDTGTTNVRRGIRHFWQYYLAERPEKIAPEDIEVDIVDESFSDVRQPCYVLLGEDIFAGEGVDTGAEMAFRSFSETKVMRYPRNVASNELQQKTAMLMRERFPGAIIIMFKNPPAMPTFTLTKFDEVKEGVSREVAVVAQGLRHVHRMLGGVDDESEPA
jgi:hypothetical protein